MKNALLTSAEECFQEARVTDELCSASIKKYRSSIKRFAAVACPGKPEDLSNADFNHFITAMKEQNVSNTSIANVIASVKWVVTRLQERGMTFHRLDLPAVKKPRVMKKETNYLTEEEVGKFISAVRQDMAKRETVKNVRFMACVTLLLQTV